MAKVESFSHFEAGRGAVSAMDNIPGAYLEKLWLALESARVDPRPFFLSAGIASERKDLRFGEFSYRRYVEVVNKVLEKEILPGLATQMGRRFEFSDFGVIGYAMHSSKSLRDSLDILLRYEKIFGGEMLIRSFCEIHQGAVSLGAECLLPPGPLRDFELELMMAQKIAFLMEMDSTGEMRFSEAHFEFERPDHSSQIENVLGCPAYFGKQKSAVLFPVSWLDMPMIGSNEIVAAACLEQCEMIARHLQGAGTLAMQIRTRIRQAPHAVPSLGEIAEEFNLSTRTLRRRLKTEGFTYGQLIEEVRMKLASQWLCDTTLPIKEIAYLLGFSEASNFQRAFKRWANDTPLQHRKARKEFSPHF